MDKPTIDDPAVATQIIAEAKSHGVTKMAMPDDVGTAITEANRLLGQAIAAHNAGSKGAAVLSILSLAGASPEQPATEPAHVESERASENGAEGVASEERAVPADEPNSSVAEAGDPLAADAPSAPSQKSFVDEAYEHKARAEARIKKERLPVPVEIEGEPPEIPYDLTTVSDNEARRLHSQFHACFARASWLIALEEADEAAAKDVLDHYETKALNSVDKTTDKGERKLEKVLKAEIAQDSRVQEWRAKLDGHRQSMRLMKNLRDTYDRTCDRLSRDWSMREKDIKSAR